MAYQSPSSALWGSEKGDTHQVVTMKRNIVFRAVNGKLERKENE